MIKVQSFPNGKLQGIHLRVLSDAMSTGVLEGGIITANGDGTFDLSVGRGYIVDLHSDSANPTFIELLWEAESDVELLDTGDISYISISNTGVLEQSDSPPSTEDRRTSLYLGRVSVADEIAVQEQTPVWSPVSQIADVLSAVGPVNISGNVFEPNGLNLDLDKTAGSGIRLGANFGSSYGAPHNKDCDALSATSMTYVTEGLLGGITLTAATEIDPANYKDPATGLVTPIVLTRWTVQRIHLSVPTNLVFVEYGQVLYTSAEEAISGIFQDAYAWRTNGTVDTDLLRRCFLVVRSDATNLSDSSEALFIPCNKFGGVPA